MYSETYLKVYCISCFHWLRNFRQMILPLCIFVSSPVVIRKVDPYMTEMLWETEMTYQEVLDTKWVLGKWTGVYHYESELREEIAGQEYLMFFDHKSTLPWWCDPNYPTLSLSLSVSLTRTHTQSVQFIQAEGKTTADQLFSLGIQFIDITCSQETLSTPGTFTK